MKRNVQLFLAYQFFFALVFFGPFWQQFCNTTLGISQSSIFVIENLMVPILLVFEIFSGVMADRFSRKLMLVIGPLFCAGSMLCLAFTQGIKLYALSDFLWCVGWVIISGTDVAMLRDSMNGEFVEQKFRRILNLATSLGLVVTSLSNVLPGILIAMGVFTDLRITMLATVPASIACSTCALFMNEPKRNTIKSSRHILIIGTSQVLKQKKVLLLGFFFSMLMLSGVHLFYQPYFARIQLPVSMYGVAFGIFNLVAAIASHYSTAIEKKFGITGTMMAMSIVRVMSWIAMATLFPRFGWVFIFSEQIVRGMSKPMLDDLANREISPEVRATALSVLPQFVRIINVPILMFGGIMIDKGMMSLELILLSIISLSGCLAATYLIRKNGFH